MNAGNTFKPNKSEMLVKDTPNHAVVLQAANTIIVFYLLFCVNTVEDTTINIVLERTVLACLVLALIAIAFVLTSTFYLFSKSYCCISAPANDENDEFDEVIVEPHQSHQKGQHVFESKEIASYVNIIHSILIIISWDIIWLLLVINSDHDSVADNMILLFANIMILLYPTVMNFAMSSRLKIFIWLIQSVMIISYSAIEAQRSAQYNDIFETSDVALLNILYWLMMCHVNYSIWYAEIRQIRRQEEEQEKFDAIREEMEADNIAQQTRARTMIANAAHDLKTVSEVDLKKS